MTEYRYSETEICYMGNGSMLTLPLHELKGGDGPTVGLCAAIHGDEVIGVEILRRVVEILKKEEISGTVKIIPVVNSLAFEESSRNTPIDKNNLNRVFPGNAQGMVTEKLAHKFLTEFVYTLDAFVDLHSGGRDPIVDYVYIINDEPMSRAFGSRILFRPSVDYYGSVAIYAKEHGVPCMTVEIGGSAIREDDIKRGVAGVLNVLRHKKVLAGQPQQPGPQIVVDYIAHIDPSHGGLMVPELGVEALGTVQKGKKVLARIYNPRTLELLEEIRAPYENNLMILLRPSVNSVFPGDFSFMIGDMDNIEQ